MTAAIESMLLLLGGLTAIAVVSLSAWVALPNKPEWERGGYVLAALAISAWWTEAVAWLLFGWTLVAACGLPLMSALRRERRWLGWLVIVFVTPVVFVLLYSWLRVARLLEWLMLLSSLAALIWMARSSADSFLRSTFARGLLIWSAVCFLPVWLLWDMKPFERAISSGLREEMAGRIQWEAGPSADDPSWLSELPPASDVRCDMLLVAGACCRVQFTDGRHSEIHIYRAGLGRYTVRKFTKPDDRGMCRNPDFDPYADRGDPRWREFVPCAELRPAREVSSLVPLF